MKNTSILLLTLFAVMAAVGFGLYAYQDMTIGIVLLFAGVILGGTVLIMKREINVWVQQRTGGTLSRKEIDFLKDNFALQKFVPRDHREVFYRKVNLFKMDKEFISQNSEKRVYHPAVLLCGAYAAFFDAKSDLRIPFPSSPVYVFYGHAFPSPAFNNQLHITEYHQEDGAFLFSVPHLMKGNEAPGKFLNIALYETVSAASTDHFQNIDFPDIEALCRYGGYTLQDLEKYIGLSREHIDKTALAVSLYFIDPDRFGSAFPRPADSLASRYPLREKEVAAY